MATRKNKDFGSDTEYQEDDEDDLHELFPIPVKVASRHKPRRARSASLPVIDTSKVLVRGFRRDADYDDHDDDEQGFSTEGSFHEPQLGGDAGVCSRRSSSLPEFSVISQIKLSENSLSQRKETIRWTSALIGPKPTKKAENETFRLPPILTPSTPCNLNTNEVKKPDSLYTKVQRKTYLPRISSNDKNIFMTSRGSFNKQLRVDIDKDT